MADDVVVEPVETPATPEWAANIEDADLKGAASKFESQQSLLDAVGFKAPEAEKVDWRESISDEDGKKFAESSTDINHFVKRAIDLRKQVSSAVIKPGEDATEEQTAAYYKAMGIPDNAEGYEFPAFPETATDEDKASRAAWAERLHALQVPKETASALVQALAEESTATEAATAKADEVFVKSQEDALKTEWKGDYDTNLELAKRAFKNVAEKSSLNVDEILGIEDKTGHSLLGRSEIVRLFATIGREMAEGTLGPVLNEGELATAEENVRDLREKVAKAQEEGNSKLANQIQAKIYKLREKLSGDQAIVGDRGRVA